MGTLSHIAGKNTEWCKLYGGKIENSREIKIKYIILI